MKRLLLQYLFRGLVVVMIATLTSCSTILYIAPKKADCSGVGEQKCYLIRKTTEGNWILHYEEIKGLDYEPGFSYKVRIKKETMKNPPADRSSFQYLLLEVLEKRDVTDDIVVEDLTDKEWKLEYMRVEGIQYGVDDKIPTIEFANDEKVNGFAGCNKYFGNYALNGRTINFGELGTTRMHCEETMELEQAFLKMMNMELRGLFNDGKLVLSADGGNQMILRYK